MTDIEPQDGDPVNPIPLDAGDVIIEEIVEMCPDCDECRTTHAVKVDLRNAGSTHELMRGCAACCKEFADSLRESLPPRGAE